MRYTFLGTGSGTPSRARNVAGAALRLDDGAVWVHDCGEATQHRLLDTDLSPGRIELILITHLHGDHCYGLPGVLAAITVHGREKEPVTVVGPRGLRSWIELTRSVSRMGLAYPLRFHELPDAGLELTFRGWTIRAIEMQHRIACYGYVLEEPAHRGRFDATKADALGIIGPDRRRLVAGESVRASDGRLVQPAEVIGPTRPGRRLALLGDTSAAPQAALACRGVDFAVHECTYDASRAEQGRLWGHSTTADVAAFARAAQPGLLALTHFSSRYSDGEPDRLTVADLVREVEAGAPGVRVVAGNDLEHLELPLVREADG